MPNIKSAEKSVRTDEKKHLRNKAATSQVKTSISQAEKLILAGELEKAKGAVVSAASSLDKAAEKGIIPKNNAARRKSRLEKKLNQAVAASLREPEKKEAE